MEQEVNMKITCIAVQSGERVGQVFVHGVRSFVEKQKSATVSRQRHTKMFILWSDFFYSDCGV